MIFAQLFIFFSTAFSGLFFSLITAIATFFSLFHSFPNPYYCYLYYIH